MVGIYGEESWKAVPNSSETYTRLLESDVALSQHASPYAMNDIK